MKSLYLPMTEKLIAHWRANGNAYPQKFILTPEQHTVYVETRKNGIGGPNIDGFEHMGVRVEVSDSTPGVMIAADGTEVSLVSAEE
ncbi:hypothetical protein D3C85_1287810 [compost metagenome]